MGYIIEERFFGQQEDFDPLLAVGNEGIAGFVFWAIALPIMQVVRCDMKAPQSSPTSHWSPLKVSTP
jgi:hypothetical protein